MDQQAADNGQQNCSRFRTCPARMTGAIVKNESKGTASPEHRVLGLNPVDFFQEQEPLRAQLRCPALNHRPWLSQVGQEKAAGDEIALLYREENLCDIVSHERQTLSRVSES